MLLYKAWRESRGRFLVGLLALAGYCFIMAFQQSEGGSFSDRLFGGSLFFELLVIVLAAGGLLRERGQHTAVFTLTLPVNRLQLVGGHVTVGLAETVVLALVPALMAGPLAALTHQTVSAEDVMRYCLLRVLCGGFVFAISFLVSVWLPGAYTAPVVCFIVLFMENRVAWWVPPLRPYLLIPQATMNGHWGYQGIRSIRDPLPTAGLLIMVLMTIALFLAATRITQEEDL